MVAEEQNVQNVYHGPIVSLRNLGFHDLNFFGQKNSSITTNDGNIHQ